MWKNVSMVGEKKSQYCIEKGVITAVQVIVVANSFLYSLLVKSLGLVRALLPPILSSFGTCFFVKPCRLCHCYVKVIGSHNTTPNYKGKTPRQLPEASWLFGWGPGLTAQLRVRSRS